MNTSQGDKVTSGANYRQDKAPYRVLRPYFCEQNPGEVEPGRRSRTALSLVLLGGPELDKSP